MLGDEYENYQIFKLDEILNDNNKNSCPNLYQENVIKNKLTHIAENNVGILRL